MALTDLKELRQRLSRAVNSFSYAYSACSEGALAQVNTKLYAALPLRADAGRKVASFPGSFVTVPPCFSQMVKVWLLEEEEARAGRTACLSTKVRQWQPCPDAALDCVGAFRACTPCPACAHRCAQESFMHATPMRTPPYARQSWTPCRAPRSASWARPIC